MKKCTFCGAELKDDSLFCTECGKELPKGIECPHCGASVNEGDVFCTECGKKIDEVPQAAFSEPTKPKCPHCGALINEGDIFCMECDKKVEELQTEIKNEVVATKECPHCGATMRVEARFCPNCDKYVNNESCETASETPQTEEETQDFNYSYVEEEPKTWRDYKLPIFGGIFLVLFLGACWWYYDSSTQRAEREKAIVDSLELVRQDSIKKATQKMLAEEEEAIKKGMETESEQFCKQFSVENLLGLLANFGDSSYDNKNVLPLLYREVEDEGEMDCTEIVYGKYIKKGDKTESGYCISGLTSHSCFLQINQCGSSGASLNFGSEEDANSFFEKVLKYGVIENEGTYYFPKKKLSDGGVMHVDELSWDGDYAPIYAISRPVFDRGFYSLGIGLDF